MNTDPKPDDILKAVNDDPIIRAVIMRWRHGDSTWEQAMMIAVLALSERNAELQEQVIAYMDAAPAPPPGSVTRPSDR